MHKWQSISAIDPPINIDRVSEPNDLASQLNGILSANDTQDEFNNLNSIGNWNFINDMNAQGREERMAKNKEIDSQITQITIEPYSLTLKRPLEKNVQELPNLTKKMRIKTL